MAMHDTVELPHGKVVLEARPGYLFVVEHGTLRSVEEVERYGAAIDSAVHRTGLRKLLLDCRATEPVGREDGVRDALWDWILRRSAAEQVAFVLASELQVTSVNMVALSERAPIRAFETVHDAHRWLLGRHRSSSQTFAATRDSDAARPPRRTSSMEISLAEIRAGLETRPDATGGRSSVPPSAARPPRRPGETE